MPFFSIILCKTYDESLQKQAVNMDLRCILCTVNSSHAVKTQKDEVTCDTYWNFFKKLKIWTCFAQNGRFRDQTGGRDTTSQNGSLPFKTGGLEHMTKCIQNVSHISTNFCCIQNLAAIVLLILWTKCIQKFAEMWGTFCIHFIYINCIHLEQFLYTKCLHDFCVVTRKCHLWTAWYVKDIFHDKSPKLCQVDDEILFRTS